MTTRRLPRIGKSESTIYGPVEMSSKAEFGSDTVSFDYEIKNGMSETAYVQWDPLTTRLISPGADSSSRTVLSIHGRLGFLHKPVAAMSRATLTTRGGTTDIKKVPLYLTSKEKWVSLMTRIPKAVVEGAMIVVKHYIGGNSLGVILTAEVTRATESLFNYRYTAAAESDISYSVRWGRLSSAVWLERPGVEILVAEFRAPGLVGLLNEVAVLTRTNHQWSAISLAAMPFPQQRSEHGALRELSHLAHVYSSPYVQSQVGQVGGSNNAPARPVTLTVPKRSSGANALHYIVTVKGPFDIAAQLRSAVGKLPGVTSAMFSPAVLKKSPDRPTYSILISATASLTETQIRRVAKPLHAKLLSFNQARW